MAFSTVVQDWWTEQLEPWLAGVLWLLRGASVKIYRFECLHQLLWSVPGSLVPEPCLSDLLGPAHSYFRVLWSGPVSNQSLWSWFFALNDSLTIPGKDDSTKRVPNLRTKQMFLPQVRHEWLFIQGLTLSSFCTFWPPLKSGTIHRHTFIVVTFIWILMQNPIPVSCKFLGRIWKWRHCLFFVVSPIIIIILFFLPLSRVHSWVLSHFACPTLQESLKWFHDVQG